MQCVYIWLPFSTRGGPFSGKPAAGCFLGVVYWFLSTFLKARIGYAKQWRLPRVLFVSNKTHRYVYIYTYLRLPYKSAIHVDTYASPMDPWGKLVPLRQEHIIDPLVRRKILLEAVVGLHGGSWMGIKLGKSLVAQKCLPPWHVNH